MRRVSAAAFVVCLCGVIQVGRAAIVTYDISLNTAPLIGHAAGPFSLEFQLNDGNGAGDANNTVTLSNFTFGGGAPAGLPTLTGGVSGNISSSVSLTDSGFFNDFTQGFTPGNLLKFRLSLTANLDSGGTPDEFSFAILDRTNTELPTTAGSFFDVFVSIDIDSANPAVTTFASDRARTPAGGGPPINIGAPQIAAVPEPSTAALAACCLPLLWFAIRRKRAEE